MEKKPFIISPFRHSSKPAVPSRARTLEEKWLEKAHAAVELLEGKTPLPPNLHNWCLGQLKCYKKNPENFSETQHLLIVKIRNLLHPSAPREFAKAKESDSPSKPAAIAPRLPAPSPAQAASEGSVPLDKWGDSPFDFPPVLREKYMRLKRAKETA